jgi:hypothetical protein
MPLAKPVLRLDVLKPMIGPVVDPPTVALFNEMLYEAVHVERKRSTDRVTNHQISRLAIDCVIYVPEKLSLAGRVRADNEN